MKILSPTATAGNAASWIPIPMIGDIALHSQESRQCSLYIHIPFCRRKCDYCHFYVLPDREDLKDLLLTALLQELHNVHDLLKDKQIVSIYFGGGTPFLFGPHRLQNLMQHIPFSQKAEVTIEANPESVTLESLKGYVQAGVNRISLGVQSFDDAALKMLTRQHSASKALEAIEIVQKTGIANISIDLMYDLPGQTLQQWSQTLARARQLPLSHLSLYNLTIEPHTVFHKYRERITPALPSPEKSAAMYQMALDAFSQDGWQPYEISAFCKSGLYSIHNTGYWTNRPFLGLGPSAYSYWHGIRHRNCPHLHRYARAMQEKRSAVDEADNLNSQERAQEALALGLRLTQGVDLSRFCYSLDAQTLETLDDLLKKGLLCRANNIYRLSPKGRLFYDTVASDII